MLKLEALQLFCTSQLSPENPLWHSHLQFPRPILPVGVPPFKHTAPFAAATHGSDDLGNWQLIPSKAWVHWQMQFSSFPSPAGVPEFKHGSPF